MNLNIITNLPEFRQLMAKRKRLAKTIIRKAVIDATTAVFTISREWMVALIYAIAIPLRKRWRARIKSGKRAGKWRKFRKATFKAAWRRTSKLLRSERFYFRGSGDELTGTIDNDTPYAQARHDNKKRPAPWRDKARAQGAGRAQEIFRGALATLQNP